MIRMPDEGAAQDLNIDLWTVPVAEVANLLGAVSVDCFLGYLYSVLLHRTPDSAGAAHYRQSVITGRSRQSVVADLLASGEFLDRHGAKHRRRQPVDEFVRQTYQDVLGRWPDEDGSQTYVRIGRKWRGRSKVERNILNSTEGRRLGGGRLARIKALQAYAKQARMLKLPIIGTRLHQHNEIVTRLAKIERLMTMRLAGSVIQQLGPPPVHVPVPAKHAPTPHAVSAGRQTVAAYPEHPMPREARIDTLDAATATKLEKDGWVFRVAVRDARRKELARNGLDKARN